MVKYLFAVFLALLLLLPTPVQAADPLCLNCHAEKALLSREPCTVWQEHSHPVYVKPSNNVTIPDQYPLNERGEIDCNTCHDVFGKSPPGEDKVPKNFTGRFLLRGKPHNSIMCKQCHIPKVAVAMEKQSGTDRYGMILDETFVPDKLGNYMDGKKIYFNHPVDIQMPRLPRKITDSGGRAGVKKDQIICETCHTAHFANGDSLLVIDNSESELCGQCHASEFGRNREFTATKGTHPVNIIPSTAVLSNIITFQGGKLGRDGKMVCLTCHSVHEALVSENLLVHKNEKNLFCFPCHRDIKEKIEGTRHDLRLWAPQEKNAWGQTAEEGGLCSPCHRVHGGKSIKMWSRNLKKNNPEDPVKNLCLSCHAKGEIASAKRIGSHTHPTGVSISLADNPYARLPLFSRNGVKTGQGLVTCASCHNVHQWDPTSDDKGKDFQQEGDNNNSFLQQRNIQSSLCNECHVGPRQIEGSSHDLNNAIYKESLAPQLVLRGRKKSVSALGTCGHCHTVHNAVSVMLWARQIGTGDDYISRICFSCHSDSMVAQNRQIGKNTHPVNIGIDTLPEEVHPELPLFSSSLRKEVRGKIFCNTCHDSHRWDPTNENQWDTGKSDSSNSYLRISAVDPEKNLCQECHPKQGLIKDTGHDLLAQDSESENLDGKTPNQSGTCGVCHASHNAATQVMLWNLPFGEGEDLFSRACASCHNEDGDGPEIGISHPVNISTFSVLDDLSITTMPIYDEKYNAIKIEMDPSLSPLQVQSILTLEQGEESYRDDPNLVAKFNLMKRSYIDIKSEKEQIKEKLLSFIDKKESLRESISQSDEEFKKINEEIAQKGQIFWQLKESFRELKRNVGVGDAEVITIKRELGILETPGKQPYSSPRPTRGPPTNLVKPKPEPTSPKKKKKPENERLIKAKKKHEKAVKKYEDAQNKFALLDKERKSLLSLRNKIKLENNKIKKDYDDLNPKQEKENKKYKLLKAKLSDIKEQLKEINPRSFMEVERDLEKELRIGEELLNESEMNYKIKYLILQSKLDELKTKDDTVRGKYRSMRTRYMDLLLKPELRKKIPKMELDTVLDEELMDEIIGDVEREPQGKMFCPTCHDVHSWAGKHETDGSGEDQENEPMGGFLRIPSNGDSPLCINCHREKEWIIGTNHDLRITAPDEENSFDNTVEDSGICSACHLVHNAVDDFNLWAKKIDREKIEQLTAARKRKKELVKIIRLRKTELKQVTRRMVKAKTVKTPKTRSLKKSKAKLIRLRKKLKKIDDLKKITPKQRELVKRKFKQQIKFLTKYIKKVINISTKSSKYLQKIKNDYKKLRKFFKGAKTEYVLLKEKISRMEKELSRSNWDAHSLLCNSCHGENLCAEDKIIGYNSHPMNVRGREFLKEVVEEDTQVADEEAQDYEEQDKTALDSLQKMLAYPLYTQEGKRNFESGRMFCPTCHNIHQWDPRNPSRGSGNQEEGDINNSFLRDVSFPSPTLCINCHPQNVLVAGTEHDLSISAPYAKNFLGKTAATGGICSPCHEVHNSIDRYRLWARPLGPSYLPSWSKQYRLKEFKSIQLCTSCHQKGQWAEKKTPASGLHYYSPLYFLKEVEQILVNPEFDYYDYELKNKSIKMGVREILNGAKPKYPVHMPDGTISDRGNITCSTCHEPHQWDPNQKKEGPGKRVEGNVTTSFLRKDIAKNFCSDCHKNEALYKYTYYHLPRNRLSLNREIKPTNPHWKKIMDNQSCIACHQEESDILIHPVDIPMDKDSKQYKYPEKIPINDGKISCVSCHNPKIQTERFAMVRGKNRYFLRGLYDNLTQKTAAKKTQSQAVMIGGPPAAMLNLLGGPKNLGAFATAQEMKEDTTTSWIRMSKFIQHQVCYNCHKKEEYQPFSPHKHQIKDGKIIPEVCSICHKKIPNRKNILGNEKGFKLRAEIEFYCLPCHQDLEKDHPGGSKHYGKIMTKKLLKQFDTVTVRDPTSRYMPKKNGKLICVSCHNIHQKGVILDPKAGYGRAENKWLRYEGKDKCVPCHKRSKEYTPVKGASPF